MNKSYVVSNNKLIKIEKKGETDVLDNTKSNLKKKQLENDLRKLKEKLEEKNEQLILDLKNEGYKAKDISRIVKVDMTFVEQTLSK